MTLEEFARVPHHASSPARKHPPTPPFAHLHTHAHTLREFRKRRRKSMVICHDIAYYSTSQLACRFTAMRNYSSVSRRFSCVLWKVWDLFTRLDGLSHCRQAPPLEWSFVLFPKQAEARLFRWFGTPWCWRASSGWIVIWIPYNRLSLQGTTCVYYVRSEVSIIWEPLSLLINYCKCSIEFGVSCDKWRWTNLKLNLFWAHGLLYYVRLSRLIWGRFVAYLMI